MAKFSVAKIQTKPQAMVHREASSKRQAARRVGIDVPKPPLSLPETEQEATDIA